MPDHLCDPYAVEFVGRPPDRVEATCCGRTWYLTRRGWSDTPPLERIESVDRLLSHALAGPVRAPRDRAGG